MLLGEVYCSLKENYTSWSTRLHAHNFVISCRWCVIYLTFSVMISLWFGPLTLKLSVCKQLYMQKFFAIIDACRWVLGHFDYKLKHYIPQYCVSEAETLYTTVLCFGGIFWNQMPFSPKIGGAGPLSAIIYACGWTVNKGRQVGFTGGTIFRDEDVCKK